MDIQFLDTEKIANRLLDAWLWSVKEYGHSGAEALVEVFSCKLANVNIWMNSTSLWVEVSSSTNDGGHSKKIEMKSCLNSEIEEIVKELLSYVLITNIELKEEYLDDSRYCPMCSTELYEDEQYCPCCRELVR